MLDQFLIHLLQFVVLWLNALPSDSSFCEIYFPSEIVTGLQIDCHKDCHACWFFCMKASENEDVTNAMWDHTAPCICLGPTGKIQGSVMCYS